MTMCLPSCLPACPVARDVDVPDADCAPRYARPAPHYANHSTPMKGLYLCGAGAHPGGGVMGAAGRNCARVVLDDTRK